MDPLTHKILTQLLQCILQSRIDIQKKQIRHFDQINKKILNHYYKHNHKENTGKALMEFLESLVLVEKYGFTGKMSRSQGYQSVSIVFRLVDRQTGVATIAEIWLLQLEQFKPIQQDNCQQEFQAVISLFQDLIIFLNRQPLFSQYQSNQKMKNCFSLQYDLHIQSQAQSKSKTNSNKISSTILQINRKHTRQRVCHSFLIKLQCNFIDPLSQCIFSSSTSSQFPSTTLKHKKQQIDTIDTIQNKNLLTSISTSTKQKQKPKKYSVYEFYDKDLDFIFLSSDDETFKKNPKADVKEINISSYIDDSEEFQLLVVSKDEEFLDDCKLGFGELAAEEGKYFTN